MNTWLAPSLIATLSSMIVMSLIYTYLYYQEREETLKFFLIAWIYFVIRLSARLLYLLIPQYQLLLDIISATSLLNSIWLCLGVYSLIGGKLNKAIPKMISYSPVALLIIFGLIQIQHIENTIVFFISGSLYILSGIQLIFYKKSKLKLFNIIGVNYILWGLHKYDYPLFYDSVRFAPIGYLLAALFSFIAALSILILYYELQKKAFYKNETRLSSLMEISDTPDVVDLLDKVLNIAIKITESKYGYIYRYDEQKRQFILNTWSKDVHADCKVVKRLTTYDLDKTGCWGEVVRQRTPFLLNDYSSQNEFVKSIPKGHIEIKKILAIPVFSNNAITATIGVANKDFDYDEGDIRQLTLLMNATWKIVEQKDYEKKLRIAKEKAEGSDRLKSAFLSNISHEIRTPLNGLLGFSRLLADGRYDEIDRYKFLQNINQSGERLTQTIDAMIDISIIEANLIEINLSNISVHDLLNDLTALFKPEAEKKGLEFICTNTEDVKIQVDEYKLKTVLSNLIQNSLKFTKKGKLELGFNSYENNNEFFVSDTGIGVPMAQQAKIFNLFEQVENDYTRNFQGIGLGLSIAKAYVEAMGGRMSMESVESNPESGLSGWSIFKVAIKNHIKIEAVQNS